MSIKRGGPVEGRVRVVRGPLGSRLKAMPGGCVRYQQHKHSLHDRSADADVTARSL
jgi:hypothetical protein